MEKFWKTISNFFNQIKEFIFKNYSNPVLWAMILLGIFIIVSFAMSKLKER